MSNEIIKLAEKYGYRINELINEAHLLSSEVIKLLRAAYIAGKPISKFARKN